jgi:hypothetical protein
LLLPRAPVAERAAMHEPASVEASAAPPSHKTAV